MRTRLMSVLNDIHAPYVEDLIGSSCGFDRMRWNREDDTLRLDLVSCVGGRVEIRLDPIAVRDYNEGRKGEDCAKHMDVFVKYIMRVVKLATWKLVEKMGRTMTYDERGRFCIHE